MEEHPRELEEILAAQAEEEVAENPEPAAGPQEG